MSDIKQLIQQIAGTRNEDKVTLLQCTVDSVDLAKRTCKVTTVTGSAPVEFEAKLQAGVADGILVEPDTGSTVYVLMSKYSLPFVVQYSDIVGLGLLGDEFGGLVKAIELTKKINNLENKVNDIIALYNAHVHSALNAPTASLVVGTLTPTQQSDIENKDITHGNGSN